MAKARFYIKNNVQDVEYRLFIIQRILDSDLEGTARNLHDGRVEVLLKGEKEHIEDFVERLKEGKPELAENPTRSKIEYNDYLIIADAMRSSQGLIAEHIGKGVPMLVSINKEIKEMRGEMKEMRAEQKEGFSEINKSLDKLPVRIAEELKNVLT